MTKFRLISASFLMLMGTVGSGIFVLPYVFAHSNFIFAVVFLIFLTIVTAVLNHFYVDIVTATPGDHQLSGYAQIYLGKKFKLVTSLNLLILGFGAITAYFKLFQTFFSLLFSSVSSFSPLIFLIIIFNLYYFRQKLSRNIFILIPVFILVVPLVLFIFSFFYPYVPSTTFQIPNFGFYGPTIFALSGFTVIPEVQELLGSNKKLSLAVLLGLLFSTAIYFLFAYSVIKLSGSNLSIDSVTGLINSVPQLSIIIALFGLIITLKSSANFLVILRELFYRDLKINLPTANHLPLIFPLIAISLNSISLITIISLTGQITIFLSAIIICLIRLRISHSFATEFFAILIIITLTLGLWS